MRQLVAAEAHALAGAAALSYASQALAAASPHDVLAGALRHFQQLFECPRLEGVVATMNKASALAADSEWLLVGAQALHSLCALLITQCRAQVYMSLAEQRNFVRSLSDLLGLPPAASTAACAAAVQRALQELEDERRRGRERPPGEVVVAAAQQQGHHEAPAAGAVGLEGAAALQQLQRLFQAATPAQAAEAGGRLVQRLKRLDEVLPRYQRVASQLYELLRVRVLDEVVPAVAALVAQGQAQGLRALPEAEAGTRRECILCMYPLLRPPRASPSPSPPSPTSRSRAESTQRCRSRRSRWPPLPQWAWQAASLAGTKAGRSRHTTFLPPANGDRLSLWSWSSAGTTRPR